MASYNHPIPPTHLPNPQGTYIPPNQNPQQHFPQPPFQNLSIQANPNNLHIAQNATHASQNQTFLTKIQNVDKNIEKVGYGFYKHMLHVILVLCLVPTYYGISIFPFASDKNAAIASGEFLLVVLTTWACVLQLQALSQKNILKGKVAFALMIVLTVIAVGTALIILLYEWNYPYTEVHPELNLGVILAMILFGSGIVLSRKVKGFLNERDGLVKAEKKRERLSVNSIY